LAQKKASSSRRSSAKKGAGRKRTSKASEYVREEMHEVKEGRSRNPKQAIAIGLSRARRAGEDVPPPKKGKTSAATRKKAQRDTQAGRKRSGAKAVTKKRTAKKAATKKRGARKSARKR
jgi:hypothetical protein